MKKIKILTSIVGLSSLTVGLVPTIASCSCNNNGYSVELVSKVKERTFNKKTGGSAWTFKLADVETAANTKVKLINLTVDGAETQPVSGLIKSSYDSAGNIKATVKTNTLLTQWPNATKFEFSFEFTNKVTKQTTTVGGFNLSVDQSTSSVSFSECEWSYIKEKTDALYNGTLTEAEFFASFTKEGETAITKWDDFIGLERSGDAGLTMNTRDHTVRVIGTNHDILSPAAPKSNTAIFTFELVTLLSKSDGDYMWTYWDSTNNYDFPNSILNANLNGGSAKTFTTPAIDLLPTEVTNCIKTVTKEVATTSSYSVNTYNTKLFPLTFTEMAQTGGSFSQYAKVEGSPYKYWTDHNSNDARIKRNVYGNTFQYCVRSPFTSDKKSVFYVNSEGNVYGYSVTNIFGISFAFCI